MTRVCSGRMITNISMYVSIGKTLIPISIYTPLISTHHMHAILHHNHGHIRTYPIIYVLYMQQQECLHISDVTHTHARAHAHTQKHTQTRTYVHTTCTHAYTHTHTHTDKDIDIQTCTNTHM